MKTSLRAFPLLAALGVFLLTIPYAQATLTGLWEFENSGNLLEATIGTDLSLVGTDLAVAGSGGTDTGATQVGVGSHYIVTHGMAPNGGGAGLYVNNYTVLWDVLIPASSGGDYASLFQTSPTNANDGDFFRNPTGKLGVGNGTSANTLGYSANSLATDTWARVVLSVSTTNFTRVYVDGDLWLDNNKATLDGRFAPDPTFRVLADESGEDPTTLLSNLAVWDTALDADAIRALGVAGDPIQVPEPSSIALIVLSIAAFGFFRRK